MAVLLHLQSIGPFTASVILGKRVVGDCSMIKIIAAMCNELASKTRTGASWGPLAAVFKMSRLQKTAIR